jgi:hypothetical protein
VSEARLLPGPNGSPPWHLPTFYLRSKIRHKTFLFFFSLGEKFGFPPSTTLPVYCRRRFLYPVLPPDLVNSSVGIRGSFLFVIMPNLTNGTGDAAVVQPNVRLENYADALKVFEQEYSGKDGIDAKTLMDSAKHGGLTYNDFLMLPGYIGRQPLVRIARQPL